MARSQFRVAAVQAVPVFMDLAGSVEKTIALIGEAADNGAALVAFSEAWIPGFPFWVFVNAPFQGMPHFAAYKQNSLAVDSDEMRAIQDAAQEHGIHVALGFSELGGDSLYLAQALIDDQGAFVFARRKLKPTMAERMVFGEGDGSDLVVADTDIGRIGALCCWEHLGPLNKFALYAQREQIHFAAWPSFGLDQDAVYAFGHEVNNAASKIYAVEGQCFVLAPCAVTDDALLKTIAGSAEAAAPFRTGGGYTMIYGPDGRELVEPLGEHEEGILYADIDLGMIDMAKIAYDPNGHYARPDVVRLWLNDEPMAPVQRAYDDSDDTLESGGDDAD
ncbi:MAG: carbon-nitrogen hydrolase family protein [Chromatiales bacterium]|nr:MAG: carbon-nitrogen hydrolase family protein [Chromatiales bacterium]